VDAAEPGFPQRGQRRLEGPCSAVEPPPSGTEHVIDAAAGTTQRRPAGRPGGVFCVGQALISDWGRGHRQPDPGPASLYDGPAAWAARSGGRVRRRRQAGVVARVGRPRPVAGTDRGGSRSIAAGARAELVPAAATFSSARKTPRSFGCDVSSASRGRRARRSGPAGLPDGSARAAEKLRPGEPGSEPAADPVGRSLPPAGRRGAAAEPVVGGRRPLPARCVALMIKRTSIDDLDRTGRAAGVPKLDEAGPDVAHHSAAPGQVKIGAFGLALPRHPSWTGGQRHVVPAGVVAHDVGRTYASSFGRRRRQADGTGGNPQAIEVGGRVPALPGAAVLADGAAGSRVRRPAAVTVGRATGLR
jgi:hypothetical protein